MSQMEGSSRKVQLACLGRGSSAPVCAARHACLPPTQVEEAWGRCGSERRMQEKRKQGVCVQVGGIINERLFF